MITRFSRTGTELNIADPDTDIYYSIGLSGRLKILPRSALTLQAIPPITNAANLDWNVGVGIDIETGGHVFKCFLPHPGH
jgi:hypothetical protein